MKIGILTFHRAYNYGAVLQCYALKETLRKMGHEVYVIDYRQPDIERFYKYRSRFNLKNAFKMSFLGVLKFFLLSPLREVKRIIVHHRFKRTFEGFQKNYLNLTLKYISSIPDYFDRYIIGSDMLWTYDASSDHFEPFYLGEFKHKPDSRVIGYAISGTPDSFHRLGKELNYSFLGNFDAVSVRERALAEIVKEYSNREITCCIDPTMLTTKELWENVVNKNWENKRYIVTYFLRVNGAEGVDLKRKVQLLAKKEDLDVINIDVISASNPLSVEDFVSIIGNAKYVVTDSFHGMVFSLIFERPFHVLKLHDSHDTRYVDILQTIGAEELAVDTSFTPFIPQVDYKVLNERIDQFKGSSIEYLRKNIK